MRTQAKKRRLPLKRHMHTNGCHITEIKLGYESAMCDKMTLGGGQAALVYTRYPLFVVGDSVSGTGVQCSNS